MAAKRWANEIPERGDEAVHVTGEDLDFGGLDTEALRRCLEDVARPGDPASVERVISLVEGRGFGRGLGWREPREPTAK